MAVEIRPAQYRNLRDLGSFLSGRGHNQEAITYLQRAADLAPDEPWVVYGLGAAQLAAGEYATAGKEFRTCLALGNLPDAANGLAVVLLYENRNREAVHYLLKIAKTEPDRYLAWMNLGTAYRRLGEARQSKRAFERGLTLAEAELARNPRSETLRAYLAFMYAELGSKRRAEFELEQAMQGLPQDAGTLMAAICAYEALGRRDDALATAAMTPPSVMASLSRWPDLGDLQRDPRFSKLRQDQLKAERK